MLLVYRPGLLPDPKATIRRWGEWRRVSVLSELHLVYVQSFDRLDPHEIGFDAAVEFPPNNTTLAPVTARQLLLNSEYTGEVQDWRQLARASIEQTEPTYPRYQTVNPGWDNEPLRSGRGRILLHSSPRGYRDWLRHAIATARRRFAARQLVFINAWNERAEGAVLEPDNRLGYALLEATRAALQPFSTADERPCAVIHIWYPELLDELVGTLTASGIDWRVIITTTVSEAAVRNRVAELCPSAEIEVFENRGRDILPFLHVTNRLPDEGVTTALKLHGKRSSHRQDGEVWPRELHAEGYLQPLDYYRGENQSNVEYLTRRLGIPSPQVESDSFIAGSMFWLRPAALRALLDAHLETASFEVEEGQLDGTLAHAVERPLPWSSEGRFHHRQRSPSRRHPRRKPGPEPVRAPQRQD